MEIEVIFENEIKFLKKEFSKYDKEKIANAIEDAMVLYLHYRRIEMPDDFSFTEKNWIKRCAFSLLKNEKYLGLQSYSENGYSISIMNGMVAYDLINEIIPKVGVPKW